MFYLHIHFSFVFTLYFIYIWSFLCIFGYFNGQFSMILCLACSSAGDVNSFSVTFDVPPLSSADVIILSFRSIGTKRDTRQADHPNGLVYAVNNPSSSDFTRVRDFSNGLCFPQWSLLSPMVFAFPNGLSFPQWSLLSPMVSAFPNGLCFPQWSLLSPMVSAFFNGLCFLQWSLLCPMVSPFSNGLCVLQWSLLSPMVSALSNGLCFCWEIN